MPNYDRKSVTVLLVEDNPGDADLIREILYDSTLASFSVEYAARVSSGLERLAAGGIDAVLLDLSLPDSSGLKTFSAVHARAPQLPIIVVTGLEDEVLALEAVRAGAQDYLVKGHVSEQQLSRCILYGIERMRQRAAGALAPAAQGLTCCFWGAKGGVGTTTTALNVAAWLGREGHSAIAAELCGSRGSFSYHLRLDPIARNFASLLELPAGDVDEIEVGRRLQRFSSMRVLFGPQTVEECGEIPEEHAHAIVHALGRLAEYAIVDLGSRISPATRAAVAACDYVALVLEREPASIEAAAFALDVLRSWGLPDSLVGAIVINQTALAAPPKLEAIERRLCRPILAVIPPEADLCLIALGRGSPATLCAPESLLASGMEELGRRLMAAAASAGQTPKLVMR